MPHEFLCNAEKLLEQAMNFYGRYKWFNPAQMANIHSIFLVVLRRIYKGEQPDMAVCALPNQHRWQIVASIVNFGKENRIPENDWVLALGAQVAKNDFKRQDG